MPWVKAFGQLSTPAKYIPLKIKPKLFRVHFVVQV